MWLFVNKLIEKFKSGSIYAITSRPGVGKTQFCFNLISQIVSNECEILYVSDCLDKNEINDNIAQMPIASQNKVYFKQVFNLHKDKLKTYLNEKKYKYLILDPFDNYAYDIDFGDLKEIAIEKNIIVIVTKNLSRPPINNKRKNPVLSDIEFLDKIVGQKFFAYTDIILFLENDINTNEFKAIIGKDIHSKFGTTIIFK
jgi:replicative DNA helicase